MTLNIKVLGPGCQNCQWVEQRATAALEALRKELPGLEGSIHHVTDINEIHKYPILATPGLVVNEQLVCAGRVPTVDEVKGWLRQAWSGTSAG